MKLEVGKTYKSNINNETFKIVYREDSYFLGVHYHETTRTGEAYWFNERGGGVRFRGSWHSYTLLPTKVKKEGWINIYRPMPRQEGVLVANVGAGVWCTKELAESRGQGEVIKIEWEEDE